MPDAGLLAELPEAQAAGEARRIYAEIPPRVEYALTQKGRDAVAVVAALRAYGERWLRP